MHEANKKRAPEGSVAKSGAFRLGGFPLNSAHEFAALNQTLWVLIALLSSS